MKILLCFFLLCLPSVPLLWPPHNTVCPFSASLVLTFSLTMPLLNSRDPRTREKFLSPSVSAMAFPGNAPTTSSFKMLPRLVQGALWKWPVFCISHFFPHNDHPPELSMEFFFSLSIQSILSFSYFLSRCYCCCRVYVQGHGTGRAILQYTSFLLLHLCQGKYTFTALT